MINQPEHPCVICIKNESKYCRDCHQSICNDCVMDKKTAKFVIKNHNICVECNESVCCYKKICAKCDIYPFHMITDTVAVGSCASSYDSFDVIVNLNYPENLAKNEGDIVPQKINKKLVLHVGILDSFDKKDENLKLLTDLIPVLSKLYRNDKILFHCFAGMSRSATFAIAYLSFINNISVEECHKLVLNKRKFIEPNQTFIKVLEEFDKLKETIRVKI